MHDPEAEQKFIDDGNGINRRQIAWNDFIIVGPESDPAHVVGTHDAVAAQGDRGGMGQALNAAAAMPAYTLSDRVTWLSFQNKQTLVAAVQGDAHLINRYSVIELNPAKHPDAKLAAAHRFADWLISVNGQVAIGAFCVGDQQLFNPSADHSK